MVVGKIGPVRMDLTGPKAPSDFYKHFYNYIIIDYYDRWTENYPIEQKRDYHM